MSVFVLFILDFETANDIEHFVKQRGFIYIASKLKLTITYSYV